MTEVELDGYTGACRVLRTDILQDAGDSTSPLIDRGQIEGGFVQGLGWLTLEELIWDANGRLTTSSASTYKLPSWSEMPEVFNVDFLTRASEPGVVFGSKAVGEPPLMLAISVREAIREAIAAFGSAGVVELDSPATPERVFWAIRRAQEGLGNGRGRARVILRATLFHTPRNPFLESGAMEVFEDGALLVENGNIAARGDYAAVRAAHPAAPVRDLRGGVLLPGFVDTHVHFPQVRALGCLGHSLLEWLQFSTLPEEAKFADVNFARTVAGEFLSALIAHGTTTALVFGAHFVPATAALFEAAAGGPRIVSGLVLSDRLLLPELHQTAEAAYCGSTELITRFHGKGRLLYAVTPRFALSASEAILEVCQTLLREHPTVRFQTHMNESPAEIAEVARLFPGAADYLAVYERFGLAGRLSVFAHNIHASSSELQRLAGHGSAVAHCPCSNAALGSGFFPLRRHLEAGVRVSMGTDVGGGTGFGMLKEGLQAYLLQRLAPEGMLLSAAQMLYLATRAGAEALGLEDLIGDFTPGKSADFVYLRAPDDSPLAAVARNSPSPERLLAATFTLAGSESVREVWVEGVSLEGWNGSRAGGSKVITEKAMSRPTA